MQRKDSFALIVARRRVNGTVFEGSNAIHHCLKCWLLEIRAGADQSVVVLEILGCISIEVVWHPDAESTKLIVEDSSGDIVRLPAMRLVKYVCWSS